MKARETAFTISDLRHHRCIAEKIVGDKAGDDKVGVDRTLAHIRSLAHQYKRAAPSGRTQWTKKECLKIKRILQILSGFPERACRFVF